MDLRNVITYLVAIILAWVVLTQSSTRVFGQNEAPAQNPVPTYQTPGNGVTVNLPPSPVASTNAIQSGALVNTNGISQTPTGASGQPMEQSAVSVVVQGTVLTEQEKKQIQDQLKQIPGVVMISNNIHVVGQINEAAGAGRTNSINTTRPKRKPGAF